MMRNGSGKETSAAGGGEGMQRKGEGECGEKGRRECSVRGGMQCEKDRVQTLPNQTEAIHPPSATKPVKDWTRTKRNSWGTGRSNLAGGRKDFTSLAMESPA